MKTSKITVHSRSLAVALLAAFTVSPLSAQEQGDTGKTDFVTMDPALNLDQLDEASFRGFRITTEPSADGGSTTILTKTFFVAQSFDGGDGPDYVAQPFDGGDGPDYIAQPFDGGDGPDYVVKPFDGGDGPDYIAHPFDGGDGPDYVAQPFDGGDGPDYLNKLVGSDAADSLVGSDAADSLVGSDAADSLVGSDAADSIFRRLVVSIEILNRDNDPELIHEIATGLDRMISWTCEGLANSGRSTLNATGNEVAFVPFAERWSQWSSVRSQLKEPLAVFSIGLWADDFEALALLNAAGILAPEEFTDSLGLWVEEGARLNGLSTGRIDVKLLQ